MKKTMVVAAMLAITLMTACKKTDTPADPDCKTGTVKLTNNSDDTYSIAIDGAVTDVMTARQTMAKILTKGSHAIGATQMNATGTPTERKTIISLDGCDTKEFMFP